MDALQAVVQELEDILRSCSDQDPLPCMVPSSGSGYQLDVDTTCHSQSEDRPIIPEDGPEALTRPNGTITVDRGAIETQLTISSTRTLLPGESAVDLQHGDLFIGKSSWHLGDAAKSDHADPRGIPAIKESSLSIADGGGPANTEVPDQNQPGHAHSDLRGNSYEGDCQISKQYSQSVDDTLDTDQCGVEVQLSSYNSIQEATGNVGYQVCGLKCQTGAVTLSGGIAESSATLPREAVVLSNVAKMNSSSNNIQIGGQITENTQHVPYSCEASNKGAPSVTLPDGTLLHVYTGGLTVAESTAAGNEWEVHNVSGGNDIGEDTTDITSLNSQLPQNETSAFHPVTSQSPDPNAQIVDQVPPKRRRGRPRKIRNTQPVQAVKVKRPRGRPRKYPRTDVSGQAMTSLSVADGSQSESKADDTVLHSEPKNLQMADRLLREVKSSMSQDGSGNSMTEHAEEQTDMVTSDNSTIGQRNSPMLMLHEQLSVALSGQQKVEEDELMQAESFEKCHKDLDKHSVATDDVETIAMSLLPNKKKESLGVLPVSSQPSAADGNIVDGIPPNRGRGRQRKIKPPQSIEDHKVKRPRGRPRNYPRTNSSHQAIISSPTVDANSRERKLTNSNEEYIDLFLECHNSEVTDAQVQEVQPSNFEYDVDNTPVQRIPLHPSSDCRGQEKPNETLTDAETYIFSVLVDTEDGDPKLSVSDTQENTLTDKEKVQERSTFNTDEGVQSAVSCHVEDVISCSDGAHIDQPPDQPVSGYRDFASLSAQLGHTVTGKRPRGRPRKYPKQTIYPGQDKIKPRQKKRKNKRWTNKKKGDKKRNANLWKTEDSVKKCTSTVITEHSSTGKSCTCKLTSACNTENVLCDVHNVVIANDGNEHSEVYVIKENCVDIVVEEGDMEGLQGEDTCTLEQNQPEDTKVQFVSNSDTLDKADKCLASHVNSLGEDVNSVINNEGCQSESTYTSFDSCNITASHAAQPVKETEFVGRSEVRGSLKKPKGCAEHHMDVKQAGDVAQQTVQSGMPTSEKTESQPDVTAVNHETCNKDVDGELVSTAEDSPSALVIPVKRGRGRPRKSKVGSGRVERNPQPSPVIHSEENVKSKFAIPSSSGHGCNDSRELKRPVGRPRKHFLSPVPNKVITSQKKGKRKRLWTKKKKARKQEQHLPILDKDILTQMSISSGNFAYTCPNVQPLDNFHYPARSPSHSSLPHKPTDQLYPAHDVSSPSKQRVIQLMCCSDRGQSLINSESSASNQQSDGISQIKQESPRAHEQGCKKVPALCLQKIPKVMMAGTLKLDGNDTPTGYSKSRDKKAVHRGHLQSDSYHMGVDNSEAVPKESVPSYGTCGGSVVKLSTGRPYFYWSPLLKKNGVKTHFSSNGAESRVISLNMGQPSMWRKTARVDNSTLKRGRGGPQKHVLQQNSQTISIGNFMKRGTATNKLNKKAAKTGSIKKVLIGVASSTEMKSTEKEKSVNILPNSLSLKATKKKRGRPRKNVCTESQPVVTLKLKKKRGRPYKSEVSLHFAKHGTTEQHNEGHGIFQDTLGSTGCNPPQGPQSQPNVKVPKKRGRPRKHPIPETVVPKKRGRPRLHPESNTPKKRGRPRKHPLAEEERPKYPSVPLPITAFAYQSHRTIAGDFTGSHVNSLYYAPGDAAFVPEIGANEVSASESMGLQYTGASINCGSAEHSAVQQSSSLPGNQGRMGGGLLVDDDGWIEEEDEPPPCSESDVAVVSIPSATEVTDPTNLQNVLSHEHFESSIPDQDGQCQLAPEMVGACSDASLGQARTQPSLDADHSGNTAAIVQDPSEPQSTGVVSSIVTATSVEPVPSLSSAMFLTCLRLNDNSSIL